MTSSPSFFAIRFIAEAAILLLGRLRQPGLLQGDPNGTFVAEAWLEWEICRGSTMFRAAYSTAARAERAARLAAKLLDRELPLHYRAEYSNGRRYWESYGFDIRFGVRPLAPSEQRNGVFRIWTTDMPGTKEHQGEHASAHPLEQPTQGSLAGFRI